MFTISDSMGFTLLYFPDDSWEPCVLLKNVDALHHFVKTNSAFQTFLKHKNILIIIDASS